VSGASTQAGLSLFAADWAGLLPADALFAAALLEALPEAALFAALSAGGCVPGIGSPVNALSIEASAS